MTSWHDKWWHVYLKRVKFFWVAGEFLLYGFFVERRRFFFFDCRCAHFRKSGEPCLEIFHQLLMQNLFTLYYFNISSRKYEEKKRQNNKKKGMIRWKRCVKIKCHFSSDVTWCTFQVCKCGRLAFSNVYSIKILFDVKNEITRRQPFRPKVG